MAARRERTSISSPPTKDDREERDDDDDDDDLFGSVPTTGETEEGKVKVSREMTMGDHIHLGSGFSGG